MKYSIITFGCRVNQADSIEFEEQLLASGAAAASPADADVVIVNTCSVTATADQGARQTIRRVARDNPSARMIVTGCYATRQPDHVAALPNVAQVVVNAEKPVLLQLLRAAPSPFDAGDGPCGAAIEPGVAGRTAFTLRVQTGCSEPCSYCIIPETRGAPRSVPLDDVLGEVDRVILAGFKEIALTGVHLGSYGRDLSPRASLFELLWRLSRPGVSRGPDDSGTDCAEPLFRISSLEPMDCTTDIVGLVAGSARFAPHFHLPLQHASNRVLAAMRRPYSIEYYAALVADIRSRIPHASIGTDVIVGFPGETANDFEQLVAYLDASPLTHVHVFPYSDRPGTSASQLGDRASGAEVRERGLRVREVAQRLSTRFRDSQVGSRHRALTIEDGSQVVTGNYLKLKVPHGRSRNEWVTVKVLSHHDGELLAG